MDCAATAPFDWKRKLSSASRHTTSCEASSTSSTKARFAPTSSEVLMPLFKGPQCKGVTNISSSGPPDGLVEEIVDIKLLCINEHR